MKTNTSYTVRQSLSGLSMIGELVSCAHYRPELPTRDVFAALYRRMVEAARSGETGSLYRDTLVIAKAERIMAVPVDLSNTQFTGAALFESPFEAGYEPEILALMTEFMPSDGVFFDVGANWGYFTFHLLLDPTFQGRVVAVERVSRSMRDLRRLAATLGYESRIVALQIAAGNTPGEAPISGDGWSGNQSLVGAAPDGEVVKVARLDDTIDLAPSLLKIDVENMEAEALRGMERLLAATRAPVIFENWHAPEANSNLPLEIMLDHGYSLFVPDFVPTRPLGSSVPFVVEGELSLVPVEPSTRSNFPPRINIFAHHGALDGSRFA